MEAVLLPIMCAVPTTGRGADSRRLLSTIAQLRRTPSAFNRRAVLAAVAETELSAAAESTPASIDGRWSLLFSTQDSPASLAASPGPVQALVDATYSGFFKIAPMLAGAQADGANALARNEQFLNMTSGRVLNTVRIPLPALAGGGAALIQVHGSVRVTSEADLVDVTFERCDFSRDGADGRLSVPLPRPKGSLRTTYCDDLMRISRGGRGGVFVLIRVAPLPGKQGALAAS
eukprot:scaffold14707_cov129-Isochrysis_galbana.AAC.12